MIMKRVGISLACLMPCASAVACPPSATIEKILSLGSVYIGELHGTSQSPDLVRCLAEASIARHIKPLTVSLEIPPDAVEPTSPFWKDPDGRASQAMYALVMYLKAQQDAGLLRLHFQVLRGDQRSPDNDERAGREISTLAAEGRVIALSGNVHSRHTAPGEDVARKPSGDFVGPHVKTIALTTVHGGSAWVCMDGICAVHTIPPNSRLGVYELVDGTQAGHDWIFPMEQFTASPPKVANKAVGK
jgi:hypothetical protein